MNFSKLIILGIECVQVYIQNISSRRILTPQFSPIVSHRLSLVGSFFCRTFFQSNLLNFLNLNFSFHMHLFNSIINKNTL